MSGFLDQLQTYVSTWTIPGMGWIAGWVLVVVVLWSIYWKGTALWRAARDNDKRWFIVLLVVNTLGILEILYLYVFRKKREV